jgi:signal peptidase II
MHKKWLFLGVVALTVVGVDQWTKFLTLDRLSFAFTGAANRFSVFVSDAPAIGATGYHYAPTDPLTIAPSFLRLRYAENPGAAFGLFRNLPEHLRGPLFHLVSIGAVILIIYYYRQLTGAQIERWAKWGLPLVFGGALGNYLDRLARGFVIDFIEAHWFDKAYWPAFNVADSAICIGVGLLVVDSFVRKESKTPARTTTSRA